MGLIARFKGLLVNVQFEFRGQSAGFSWERDMATIPTLEKKYVKSKVADLRSSLQEAPSASQKGDVIRNYLAAVESDAEFLNLDTEFPPSLDWFNTPSPLSFSGQLQGKIVVLDFFTYCCINCIHVLPQLERLEHRHPVNKGVIVVGVHSAKFGNEKVSANIRNAISRYVLYNCVGKSEGSKFIPIPFSIGMVLATRL